MTRRAACYRLAINGLVSIIAMTHYAEDNMNEMNGMLLMTYVSHVLCI